MARHAGVHAAGVVIAREPLVDYLPLYKGNDGQPVTAFEMGILEKIGLLKMDFLGLSNLTVLARTVQNIRQTRGVEVDPRQFPDEDAKTYEMLARGETSGVFQLEGGGMTRYVMQLKPQNVRELAAMVALYRPGPMEHIPRFIDTKFGRIQPEYLDERMRPILEETYGIIVYQDQVLKLVQALAGFSLGKADILRRAMGKKDAKAMAEMKTEFFSGATANGLTEESCEKIWELLLPFAGYAFNKAHAVCYAILAYQTAYLKANYPIEYMAALLAVYRAKEDRVTNFIEECRRQRIPVLPPDVNCSMLDFAIEGVGQVPVCEVDGKAATNGKAKSAPRSEGAIRFGLAAIKGVGDGIVDAIIREREENGSFRHLYEFAERVRANGLNKTSLEALIRAGALDGIDSNRNKLLNVVEPALAYADIMNRDRQAGQADLFGSGEDQHTTSISYPALPDVPPPSRSENLAMEKEVMGIYVSDHPLRGYERLVHTSASHSCEAVLELEDGASVRLAGVIANIRQIVTKAKGERMATLVLEDLSGQMGVIVFPATFAKMREHLVKDTVVQLSGVVMHRERNGERSVEVRLEDIKPLEPTLDLGPLGSDNFGGFVTVKIHRATEKQLQQFRETLDRHPGSYEVLVQVMPEEEHEAFLAQQRINPDEDVVRQIKGSLARADVEVIHPRENPAEATSREPALAKVS